MTPKQHTILARMSDGEWYLGADLGASIVLGVLAHDGMIRGDFDGLRGVPLYAINWTITPDGLAALEAAG